MIFYKQFVLWLLFAAFFLFSACRTPAPETFEGYPYDPEGVTDTFDRTIEQQHKRTIGFLEDGVWISNELDGARANDVYRIAPFHYHIEIQPEITPINNSPWYGFKIWSNEPSDVTIELVYNEGRQRYTPKISRDNGSNWANAEPSEYQHHSSNNSGIISVAVSEEPTIIAAQEIYTSAHFNEWVKTITAKPFAEIIDIGLSHQQRPIQLLKYSEETGAENRGVIIIYGRQHPPEIPSYMMSLRFLETIAGDSELAQKFRAYFDVWAFPFINPDGADNGHWRTNAAGVDLNRDWQHFRQPETEAVKEALLQLKNRPNRTVFYGIDFHSTGGNIFYPIKKSIQTQPDQFTYRWAELIQEELPELNLRIEPFDTVSPIAKNWTFKTFGSDAVTFEVWDEIPREKIEPFGRRSAEIFMEMMIEEYYSLYGRE